VASTTPADAGVDLIAGDPDVGQEVIAEALQMPGLTPRPIGSDQRHENGRNGVRYRAPPPLLAVNDSIQLVCIGRKSASS
jgi:hypothetical protein